MSNINDIVLQTEYTPGIVSFNNFEAVKDALSDGLTRYENIIYTSDNLSEAKNDLKELKTIHKMLKSKQKELIDAYSMPIEEVRKQLDELIAMVKKPMDVIDKLVKETEKTAKKQDILEYAKKASSSLGSYAEALVGSEAFFNDKWLNATYKTKDWQSEINEHVRNAVDAIETIEAIGGKNKGVLRAYFFDKLTLDGAEKFLEVASSENTSDEALSVDDEDAVIGYKILKISGTERQMLKLMTQLSLSDLEVEELENGMPQAMSEIVECGFDSFVAFDIEHSGTFGIDNGDAEAEIIEIGAVKVINGLIVDKFDMLANPGRKIVPMVARLTHITDEMVADEPCVSDVIKAFKEFTGDMVLVGHNVVGCDIPHISRAAKRAGVAFENSFFDTNKYAKKFKETNGWTNTKLGYLSDVYGIELNDAHRAWCDAEATAQLYLKLLGE